MLRGWVDAANVTDNQGAHVRLASLGAAASCVQRAGVEPVMQLTCRDRNRIALQSDLLSAGALGIPNVLLLTGDHPRFGDHPDAMPVFDLDCVQLVWTARTLRDEGELLSGRAARPGGPAGSSARWRTRSRRRCASAPSGSARRSPPARSSSRPSSSSTSPGFARWMAEVRDLGLPRALRGARGRRPGPVAARAGVHAHRGPGHPRARRPGPPAARRPVRPRGRRGPRAVRRDHPGAPRDPRRGRRARHGVRLRARRPRHPRRGRVLAGPRARSRCAAPRVAAVPGEG